MNRNLSFESADSAKVLLLWSWKGMQQVKHRAGSSCSLGEHSLIAPPLFQGEPPVRRVVMNSSDHISALIGRQDGTPMMLIKVDPHQIYRGRGYPPIRGRVLSLLAGLVPVFESLV